MYDKTSGLLDILVVAAVVAIAAYYLYRKLFKRKNACGGGCDSCPSAVKKGHKPSVD